MHTKKIKDNKPYKFTFRVTDLQYSFVLNRSSIIGISPSDYIRMLIDFKIIESKGVHNNENIKNDFND